MKKRIALVLAIVLMMTSAGCGTTSKDSISLRDKVHDSVQVTATEPGQPAPVETTQPERAPVLTPSQDRQDALVTAADFGFPELSENYGIMDYLQDQYPWWLEENDFVWDISEEQIIRTCDYDVPANLMCIAPASAGVSLRVEVGHLTDEEPYEKWSVAYQSKNGEPIFLLASDADDVNVSVNIADRKGRELIWNEEVSFSEDGEDWVRDISPVYDQKGYEEALAQGWFVPETEAFRTYHYWRSNNRYLLELSYEPGEVYDGIVWLYDYCGTSELAGEEFSANYQGYWYYTNGVLHLELEDYLFNKIEAEFSVLTDTEDGSNIAIFPCENSGVIPQFHEKMKYDVLKTYASDAMSFYDYALYEGWRMPELAELINTGWQSSLGYYLELKDDAVPGDNNGEVALYDVDNGRAFTLTYTGSWSYAEGMLHLLMVPQNNGQFIDNNFPVLMLDGELMICMNEYGSGLPDFTPETMSDVLWPYYE